MQIHRIYTSPETIDGEKFTVNDTKIVKKLVKVLRMEVGSRIILFDGTGFEYDAEIEKISDGLVEGKILLKKEVASGASFRLVLAQALPKGSKLDDVIRMNTEVGVAEFMLFESGFSVVKAKDFKEKKLDRLKKLAEEASRQSERIEVPQISLPVTFEELLKIEADVKILLHSRKTSDSKDIYEFKAKIKPGFKVLFCIGPEGGFSEGELKSAINQGFEIGFVNLPILRTETAGVVASGILLS